MQEQPRTLRDASGGDDRNLLVRGLLRRQDLLGMAGAGRAEVGEPDAVWVRSAYPGDGVAAPVQELGAERVAEHDVQAVTILDEVSEVCGVHVPSAMSAVR